MLRATISWTVLFVVISIWADQTVAAPRRPTSPYTGYYSAASAARKTGGQYSQSVKPLFYRAVAAAPAPSAVRSQYGTPMLRRNAVNPYYQSRPYTNPQTKAARVNFPTTRTPMRHNVHRIAHQQAGQRMTIQGQRRGTTQRVARGYPYLNAPLYTAPTQRVPYQVGGVFYTNQAFAPHEMLHEHEYEALYPPFFYKVGGHWIMTPWGVWSSEHWDLQGTEVEIEYKSRKPLFSLFANPF